MATRIAAVLAASLLTLPCGAQTIMGTGARPCSEWIQARRDGGHHILAEAWVMGYVSGVNASTGGKHPSGFAEGMPAILDHVDRYCGEHPADTIWAAVSAMLAQRRAS